MNGSALPARAGALRIGDRERASAADALGEHFAEGRLTREELDERLDRVWAARTADDLAPLFADLPPDGGAVVRTRPRPTSPSRPARRGGPPVWFPAAVPLFLLAVIFAIVTHAFWVLFVAWFLMCGLFRAGMPRRPVGPTWRRS
jgi:hypothetical protein